jgi:hypothetical protein
MSVKIGERESYLQSATAKKGHHEEDWRSRALQLEDELALAKTKLRKITDLENKIDLVLGHNTRLIKENELLRGQLDSRLDSAEHEQEVARLLDEIADLTDACARIERTKDCEILDLRRELDAAVGVRKEAARATENMEFY